MGTWIAFLHNLLICILELSRNRFLNSDSICVCRYQWMMLLYSGLTYQLIILHIALLILISRNVKLQCVNPGSELLVIEEARVIRISPWAGSIKSCSCSLMKLNLITAKPTLAVCYKRGDVSESHSWEIILLLIFSNLFFKLVLLLLWLCFFKVSIILLWLILVLSSISKVSFLPDTNRKTSRY